MKQISLGIFSAIILVAILVQSAKAQSMDLHLEPHGSKLIENNHSFSFDATCTIQSNEKNTIKLHVIESTGSVNGKHLNKGQATSIVVHDHDAVLVHAEPGSKLNVLNLSGHTVHASCSV